MLASDKNRPRGRRTTAALGLLAVVVAASGGTLADPVPDLVFTVPAWLAGRPMRSHHVLAAALAARAEELVEGGGGGRHERFTLTNYGAQRLLGASTPVAAVPEHMLAPFDPEQRRRLYADLAACADALSQRSG